MLALAVVLINGYGPGSGPSLIGYGAFCGGAGIVIAAVGVAACFFDRLQGVIMLGLDAFAAFFLLAGGLVSLIMDQCLLCLLTMCKGLRDQGQSWRLLQR